MIRFIRNLAGVIAWVFGIGGLLGLVYQIYQANELRRWANYNEMNLRYHELYISMPVELTQEKMREFEEYEEQVKKWVRQYFNLYSEEYYLFKENLIPKEMWTKRIASGVDVNLRQYPLLIEGYEYWKRRGAHTHPEDFQVLVDEKIRYLMDRNPGIREKLKRDDRNGLNK
jgi:hypothetical protein